MRTSASTTGSTCARVPWRRGQGYDIAALENVFTADHAWAHLVVEEIRRKIADPATMRALGYCVSVGHAHFMAAALHRARPPCRRPLGSEPSRRAAGCASRPVRRNVRAVFTVDLFNEGVDIPTVDTLLLLRPTDSPTLFLQQLGRGLRKAAGKSACTVLDFVGTHRKEFRFDRRLRALLGGSRADVERQVRHDFPFLPAGCSFHLDSVATGHRARQHPRRDPEHVARAVRRASLARRCRARRVPREQRARARGHLHRRPQLVGDASRGGPGHRAGRTSEAALLRAVGRLLHVDDDERLEAYPRLLAPGLVRRPSTTSARASSGSSACSSRRSRALSASASFADAVAQVWAHPQVRAELIEVLDLLRERVSYLDYPLGLPGVPLALHSRYTRAEIFAAFGVGDGAKPPTWQTGVWWEPQSKTDLFAFTLDKSVGGFSPTTRYRDYAISPELIHWESQSATAADSAMGQRYIRQREAGTNVVLFARLRTTDRAFWCLGPASYVSHEGDRPIAFVWKLQRRLPAELYTSFAAAVA